MTTRRSFLKTSTAMGTGLFILPRHVLGGANFIAPSDKITLGFIGAGRQGTGLGKRFQKIEACQIVAISDVDVTKMERFVEQTQAHYAQARGQDDYRGCRSYRDFRAINERDDIDAVIVSTPDHWHAIPSIQALESGKDVYCEKPLSLTIKEGRAMVEATRKNGRVFQTGSMQRSRKSFRKACELVRNGYLGEIKEIKVSIGPPPKACDLPTEHPGRDIDWNRWIGPAPYRGYHHHLAPPIPESFWPKWRDYKEFGGGGVSDWGAHMFDIAQWALGMDGSGPVEWLPANGQDRKYMTMLYENGIKMTHEDFGRGNAVRFIGTEGKLDISRRFLETTPTSIAEVELKDGDIRLYASEDHYLDFLDAIKKRTKPICDVETGHRTASICNITNICYELKRPLKWNPRKEKFKGDRIANKMRKRKVRDWEGD